MKLYNLKDNNEQVSFAQAVKQGLGKQQGLFFPQDLPEFSAAEIDELLKLDFVTRSSRILSAFIGDEIPSEELAARVKAAFAFPDDGILTKGIRQGDILWEEGENVIAVNIPDCDVIEIWISRNHPEMTAKVCYEIGNCHASLFCGRDRNSFITPYSEPMLHMLNQIPGISVTVKQAKLDFDKRISAGVSAHTH